MHKRCSRSGSQHRASEPSPCSPSVSQWIIRKRHLDTAATTVNVSVLGPKVKPRTETWCPVTGFIAEEGLLPFHLEHFNLLLPAWWHQPATSRFSVYIKGWDSSACSVVEEHVCVRVCFVKNKRHFEVKKKKKRSRLGLEFIRFWGDSGRNKSKEWGLLFFFPLLRYATTWALSLPAVSNRTPPPHSGQPALLKQHNFL